MPDDHDQGVHDHVEHDHHVHIDHFVHVHNDDGPDDYVIEFDHNVPIDNVVVFHHGARYYLVHDEYDPADDDNDG